MIKKFLSNSQFYVYSAYLPTAISFFTLPLITPFLTLRDYGLYGLIFATYSLITLVFNLGFVVEFQNAFFNNPANYKSLWSKTVGFQIVWNLLSVLPLCLILLLLTGNEMSPKETLISISSLAVSYIFLDPVKTIGSRHLQYTEKHKKLFAISTIATLVQYSLVLALIIKWEFGFTAWFLGSLVNAIITAGFFTYYLKLQGIYYQLNFSFKEMGTKIRTQSAIIMHNISGYVLETSDRVILALFKIPIEQIGAYNIAYNYTNYGQTMNNSLNTVFSPIYLQSIKGTGNKYSHAQLKELFKFWITLIFFIIVNMIIWADSLFSFLYRNAALSSTFTLAFPMIIALIHRPFYVMVVDNLIIQNKTKHIATLSISAALINLILNIVLIPFFGTIAAVYSTAIAYLYLGFAGLIFKKIKLELTGIYNTHYIFILTSAVTAIFFINYLNFNSLSIQIIISASSILVVLATNLKRIRAYFSLVK